MDYLNMMNYSVAELIGLMIRENPTSEVVKGIQDVIASDRNIYEITREELLQVKGIGAKRVDSILAALRLTQICTQPIIIGANVHINSPKDVASLLTPILGNLDREHFCILMLNTKNICIGFETISIGSLNSAIISPRELFKIAIKKSCCSLIISHNHPSGNPQPSREDISLTERLIECGKFLSIEVLDHILICKDSFISFKEQGII